MAKPKLKPKPILKAAEQPNSPLFLLSDELIVKIFGYLTFPELLACQTTCKLFYHIGHNERFLRRIDLTEFSAEALPMVIKRLPKWTGKEGVVQHLICRPGLPGRSDPNSKPPEYFVPSPDIQIPCFIKSICDIGRNLKYLELADLTFGGNDLESLSTHCPVLKDLVFDDVRIWPDHKCDDVLFPELSHLTITGSPDTRSNWHCVQGLTDIGLRLRSLHLVHPTFRKNCWRGPGCAHGIELRQVNSLPLLEDLAVKANSKILDLDLPRLTRLKVSPLIIDDLYIYSAFQTPDPDEDFMKRCLDRHRKLRYLSISGCSGVDMTQIKLPKTLMVLDVSSTGIGDEGIKAISDVCKLFDFTAVGCKNITNNGIVHLVKAMGETLENLNVGKCNIGDLGLDAIAKRCISLIKLNISGCNDVTSDGVRRVLAMKTLDTIRVDGLGYKVIDVMDLASSHLRILGTFKGHRFDVSSELPPAPIDESAQRQCRNCEIWLDAGLLDDHLSMCPQVERPCLMASSGCLFTGLDMDIRRHFAEECEFNRVVCYACHRSVHRSNYAEHYTRSHLVDHTELLHTCPLAWLGCNDVFESNSEVIKHLTECLYNDASVNEEDNRVQVMEM